MSCWRKYLLILSKCRWYLIYIKNFLHQLNVLIFLPQSLLEATKSRNSWFLRSCKYFVYLSLVITLFKPNQAVLFRVRNWFQISRHNRLGIDNLEFLKKYCYIIWPTYLVFFIVPSKLSVFSSFFPFGIKIILFLNKILHNFGVVDKLFSNKLLILLK